jgi:hypothetical protein
LTTTHFQKCAFYDGGYETKTICFNNSKIKGNEELIMVILNRALLHNQTGGWTGT